MIASKLAGWQAGGVDVGEALERQARACRELGSPLYADLLGHLVVDLRAGGVTADVLAGYEDDPPDSALALRLLAALHRLVLERRAPELGLYYPSVGGSASGDPWPAAERALGDHADEIRRRVGEPVQTNEVGRSTILYGGLLAVVEASGFPVRLLEVGASAGLNLYPDAYAYVVGGEVLGDRTSPVRFVEPWVGRPTAATPVVRVVERRGCDLSPVNLTTTGGRLRLTSYVWPDMPDRFERLRAAFDIPAGVPAPVERAGAAEWLDRVLAEAVPGTATVVWHSVVWQYLGDSERTAAEAALEDAGQRAHDGAPLYRLSLEPGEPGGRFEVRLTAWPGRITRLLATAEPHGPPVRW